MSDIPYILQPREQWVVQALEAIIDGIYAGNVDSLGLCSMTAGGVPTVMYYERPNGNELNPALSQLVGLYSNKKNHAIINAPYQNRSYEVH